MSDTSPGRQAGASKPVARRSRRLAAGCAVIAVVAAGLFVARGLPDSIATDVAGDALYAVAVYTGLVLLWPRARRMLLAAGASGWCIAVEFLQLSGLPAVLAERMPPVGLVLGSGFDVRDLVVYVLAVASAAGVDAGVSALLLHRGERRVDVGSPG